MVNIQTEWWSPQERRFIADEEIPYFTSNSGFVAIPLLVTEGYYNSVGNSSGVSLNSLISPSGASTSLPGFSTIDQALTTSSGYFQGEINDIDTAIGDLSSQIAGDIVDLETDISSLSGLIAGNTTLINSVSGNLQLSINDRVIRSGDTMTGFLTLNADPVNPLHAVTLQFLQSQGATLSGYFQNEIDNLSTGGGITGPSPVLNRSVVIYSGTSGDFVQDTGVSIDTNNFILTSGIKVGNTSFTPTFGDWSAILRCGPSEDGMYIKCSDDFGRFPLFIEDDDASIINLAVQTNGLVGFGNSNPQFGIDLGGSNVDNPNGTGSINTRFGSYFQESQPYRSFTQVNLTVNTNLDNTINQLPLNTSSAISVGTLFSVNSNNISISQPGLYRIVWAVTAENRNSGGAPRKTMLVDLNRNNGTFVSATQVGGYSRDTSDARVASVSNSFIIRTTSTNETVALRSRNLGTTSGDFDVIGGFLRVELIDGIL